MNFEKVSPIPKVQTVADMRPGEFAKTLTGNNLVFVTKENRVVNLNSGSIWTNDKDCYREVVVEIYEHGDQLLVHI